MAAKKKPAGSTSFAEQLQSLLPAIEVETEAQQAARIEGGDEIQLEAISQLNRLKLQIDRTIAAL
jgi:hypothetical protein